MRKSPRLLASNSKSKASRSWAAKVSGVRKTGGGPFVATIERGIETRTFLPKKSLSPWRVQGNFERLGLEGLGVKTERGCISTDAFGRTNVLGLYAIGHAAGPPMLAYKAEHDGVVCVEAIRGLNAHPLEREKIPACTYSRPQVASVGLSEATARAAGYELRIGRIPLAADGKAIALGEDQGMVKIIFDAKTGKLLGAHLVGAELTELIQGFVIAKGLETTEDGPFRAVFPHPTLSEAMHESVLAA
jgi:dihydrolipoamide dehydrogenase